MTLRRWAKKVPAANEARDLLTDRDYRRPTDLREGHRELFRLNDEPGEATLGLVTRTRALGHVEREHSIALLRDRSSVSDSRSSSSSTRVSQAQAWVMPAFEAIRAVRSCSHPTADSRRSTASAFERAPDSRLRLWSRPSSTQTARTTDPAVA